MTEQLRIPLAMVALLAGATIAEAQQVPDPRVGDLVSTGKLRVALFLPQYTKDPVTGEVRVRGQSAGTVMVQIAHTLAARLGVEVLLLGYPTPPMVVECLKAGECDVAFMGIEPSRAGEVGFSPPVVQLDYTYLVPAGSPIRRVADADRPGVRIAAVRNHASTLALSRMLKQAELVTAETHDPTFDLLRTGQADAFASARGPLLDYSSKLPGSRVLEDRYGANLLAMAVPKGRTGWLAYISEFIEESKASGWVQRAIERAGLRGVQVAPPGNLTAQKSVLHANMTFPPTTRLENPDPRVADLVSAGKLRVALFLPMYARDPETNELRGFGPGAVFIDIARSLAARMGVDVLLMGYQVPGEVVECLQTGACDIAFLGAQRSRAVEVDFSPPVVHLDYTCLVPAGSQIRTVADADRSGIRIAVVRNHASTLALGCMLKHAEQIAVEVPDAAFDLLRSGRADVFASVRPALMDYSARLPGSRVLEDRYGFNPLVMAVAKDRAGHLAYISEFIEEAKASGLVQRAIVRAGVHGVHVAPAGHLAHQQ